LIGFDAAVPLSGILACSTLLCLSNTRCPGMVQISGIDSGRSDHRRAPLTLSDHLTWAVILMQLTVGYNRQALFRVIRRGRACLGKTVVLSAAKEFLSVDTIAIHCKDGTWALHPTPTSEPALCQYSAGGSGSFRFYCSCPGVKGFALLKLCSSKQSFANRHMQR